MNFRQSQLGLGIALLLTSLLGACSSSDASTSEEPKQDPKMDPSAEPGEQQGFELLTSEVTRQAPNLPAETAATFADDNRAFALDMYAQLKDEGGNLFFSPHSISTALAMAYVGARSETKTEMAAALRFNLPDEELHAAFNAQMRALDKRQVPATDESPGVQLEVHNDIWASVDPNKRPQQSYVDSLALNYSSEVKLVDFLHAEATRETINSEIERHTHGTIPEVLAKNVIDPLTTAMILTNTIYFKAPWAKPFEKGMTQPAAFTTLAGAEETVNMMHGELGVQYAANDDLQAVRLPYLGQDLGLWVLLPKLDRFAAVEGILDSALLDELTSAAAVKVVDLKLPKVKMRSKLGLKTSLTALGMQVPFEDGRADFSGITTDAPLFIQDVVHEAFIDLDETGTEAGAATAVLFGGDSASPEPEVEFNADHTFILLLEDRATQSVLFAGRVDNPSE
jgi:serpin B